MSRAADLLFKKISMQIVLLNRMTAPEIMSQSGGLVWINKCIFNKRGHEKGIVSRLKGQL